MRTITFYSYKGGVGRSLLVANAAKYLATVGKRVFAIDFDLEAPGLQYKFALEEGSAAIDARQGLVDILFQFVSEHSLPDSLAPFASDVVVPGVSGSIRVMRAGSAPLGEYWRKLSYINWYDLFYGDEPSGVPFFLELKERIQAEFAPDFLLIDARTGITEMGGVATTLLPDAVVCLALGTPEHLEGLRAVMHGIRNATRSDPKSPVEIVPIISRLPVTRDGAVEDAVLSRILRFLNAPTAPTEPGLELREAIALHTEPLLELGEQLLVGSASSPHELPLLRDYLRLFSKIIPAQDIRPHVGDLIQKATARLLDDPDRAQSDLEALTAYCGDQEAYRALLKLYKVRKAPIDKMAQTASLMVQLGVPPDDPLIVEVARIVFSDPRQHEIQRKYPEFGEAVWRSVDTKDARLAMVVANAYLPANRDKAIRILKEAIDLVDSPPAVMVARLIDILRAATLHRDAFGVVAQFKQVMAGEAEFVAAWARTVLDAREVALAKELLVDPQFRPDVLQSDDPSLLYRVSKLAGLEKPELLSDILERAMAEGAMGRLREAGELFVEEGKWPEFDTRVRARLPRQMADELMEYVQRRIRGHRYY